MATVKLEDLQAGPVETPDATVSVSVSAANPLPLNTEVSFVLTVIDTAGNESDAKTVTVFVVDTTRPLAQAAVLDIKTGEPVNRDDAGRFLVELGAEGFILSAKGSLDPAGGQIKAYRWELKPV